MRTPIHERTVLRQTLAIVAALLLASCGRGTTANKTVPAMVPHPAPLLGVDLDYEDFPYVPLRDFAASNTAATGTGASDVLTRRLGLSALRLNSFGFYSFRGPEATAEVRRVTRAPNRLPWFPVEDAVRFSQRCGLPLVLGLNPEEGPDAAAELAERLTAGGLLRDILAFEIGNEPHLSKRPWQPEEYGRAAAAIIAALEPYGVPCAVALTIGSESKTPTGIADDDYTLRTLASIDAELGLARHPELYGVIHLYAGGVDPRSIDRLDNLVRPFAPSMRYLVTEYNIRSSLADNVHLTDSYALEFMTRTCRLVAHPKVAGLFVHAFPYHSVAYWVGDAGFATLARSGDIRLTGSDLAPGWHLTPAGRLFGLFAKYLWSGELLTFEELGPLQIWTVRGPDGASRLGVLNAGPYNARVARPLDGELVEIELGPRTAAVRTADSELGRVTLDDPDGVSVR